MRDDDAGKVERTDRLVGRLLLLNVEGARGLVEEEDSRLLVECAREEDSLLLPPG